MRCVLMHSVIIGSPLDGMCPPLAAAPAATVPNRLADLCVHCARLVLPYAGWRTAAGLSCRRCTAARSARAAERPWARARVGRARRGSGEA
jgi:hypothetical protein